MPSKYPPRAAPRRRLAADELAAYEADGAICARQLLDLETIDQMRTSLEDVISGAGVLGGNVSKATDGFHGDIFVWKLHDAFRDLALFSCLPELASQVLRSTRVCFFYEQFFVKRAGSPVATPWHQDIPFWPVQGTQLVSFWITLDPVSRESSGLEFVRGSHRWTERYKAVTPNHDPYMMDTDLPEAPNFAEMRDTHEILGWDMEPGDVLVFGPVVAHGSGANDSQDVDRRAPAFRYCGDDVTYAPRHATMPLLWDHGLEPGDRLGGPLFPQVLPEVLESEIATRWEGPEPPSPKAIEAFVAHLEATGFGGRSGKKSILTPRDRS